MTQDTPEKPAFRLFGRSQGKPLSARQQGLVDHLLPRITLPEAGMIVPKTLLPDCAEQALEIGFGAGEHLVAQATAHPEIGFIGIEPFLNGVAKALTGVDAAGLTNVRLAREDAREILPRFETGCFDRIYLLFPDPWHKKRHAKRRFVQPETRDQFARLLKPGGRLRIATDVKSYADHCMSELSGDGRFVWQADTAEDWRTPPADHITTRYETKNLGDCAPVFMDFLRD
ncbi:tRNA (guanosine(46)-N7)-methyltransferase TrmB [Maricaulis sp.]|uniref:tRNA (guanosine(46)-N7)-methyltransferase TrmB n=1 Tax=Maricaulis sp. TaxID=1486257 RepID=UPI0025DF285A|nr:tRNA (guanosine(46)-N7)-methyltransferase TrmB [Maricaulis sp.]MDF1767606.1 tRNA (guanosine(46)-N7)-methyltransferase TrmB [Maricaulis sp.]